METKVKVAFAANELTLTALARRLGISPTLVSHILSGKEKGWKHRPKIARALGLSMKELFGESNGKQRGPA